MWQYLKARMLGNQSLYISSCYSLFYDIAFRFLSQQIYGFVLVLEWSFFGKLENIKYFGNPACTVILSNITSISNNELKEKCQKDH